jgi:hypothetical protein
MMRAMPDGDVQARDTHLLLRGWKDISAHLGMSVRTAQRLAETEGLPIRRPGHQKGGVFAYVSELDVWVKRNPGHATSSAAETEFVGNAVDANDGEPEPPGRGESPAPSPSQTTAPFVSVNQTSSSSWPLRRWAMAAVLLAASVGAAALVATRANRPDGSSTTSIEAMPAEANRPPDLRAIRLRVRSGEGAAVEHLVPEGTRSLIVTAANQTLFLEPQLRGDRLHLIIYERLKEPKGGNPLQVIGTADLVGPGEPRAAPVRFLVDEGWIEVQWVK